MGQALFLRALCGYERPVYHHWNRECTIRLFSFPDHAQGTLKYTSDDLQRSPTWTATREIMDRQMLGAENLLL